LRSTGALVAAACLLKDLSSLALLSLLGGWYGLYRYRHGHSLFARRMWFRQFAQDLPQAMLAFEVLVLRAS
jgi:hypothetical protein